MNASAVAKHYGSLTPEERFRLIVAAGARGDKAEQDRLKNAGRNITYLMPDHAPYAQAFDELAHGLYLDLLAEAADYLEAFGRDAACDHLSEEDPQENGDEECGALEEEPDAQVPLGVGERYLRLALAIGFVLRTKADGWKLFCEWLSIPPFALWESLPGFDRLRCALALTDEAAFFPEGFLRWMNDGRPEGTPELTEVALTVEGIAAEIEALFQNRVQFWRG